MLVMVTTVFPWCLSPVAISWSSAMVRRWSQLLQPIKLLDSEEQSQHQPEAERMCSIIYVSSSELLFGLGLKTHQCQFNLNFQSFPNSHTVMQGQIEGQLILLLCPGTQTQPDLMSLWADGKDTRCSWSSITRKGELFFPQIFGQDECALKFFGTSANAAGRKKLLQWADVILFLFFLSCDETLPWL